MQLENSRAGLSKTQRGLGLVELMVGITVGLIVTAGAAMVATRQINEHRRLMLEVQMQQDLRIAADLIQQDLKRAGYRGGSPENGVWEPERDGGATAAKAAVASPYFAASSNQAGNEFYYRYAKKENLTNTVANDEKFGIRWDQAEQKLYIQLGMKANGTDPNWQPITDPDVVKIENFTSNVVKQQISLADLCDPTISCAGGTCPTLDVRRVVFTITAVARADSNVRRTLTVGEKLRADEISGACPT
ncbi:type IV pilus assembly protein PilW [Pelomonas saccharophila]|uniref:Type IV pilus assembly protein PilW n=1 Tax=Roseateles saccharophilus TaxID=304 RepID=A0ABU1YF40_ROSSA|nr:prepilin-type N-terminal cleavage/methylation domain-containing protein [Roseateles saccharophilus]MDR7267474.1 type IV pilus assembly protein PilW [Roseateles saccharophilus]